MDLGFMISDFGFKKQSEIHLALLPFSRFTIPLTKGGRGLSHSETLYR
jgi:hypothetical protein